MEKKWRRRNYFIKKDLQGRFIFSFFIFVLGGGLLLMAIFSFLASNSLSISYNNDSLQLGRTPFILFKEILGAHWIFAMTGGVIVVVASLFLTHRVAGPFYRFERTLEEMTRKNLDLDIRLRKRDEGKELARMLNELNRMLSSQFGEMKVLSEGIDRHLTEARASLSSAAAAGEVDQAIALNGKLREILNPFQLKRD